MNRHFVASCLLIGLLQIRADNSVRIEEAPQAPVLPEEAQRLPQAKSGVTHLQLSAESPTMDLNGHILPYALIPFHSADAGSLLIESVARDTLVPPEGYLYDADGAFLVSISFSNFESTHRTFMKPDRLQATLYLNRFPNQTLSLLLIPSAKNLAGTSEFEHPANLMAHAKTNAKVLNQTRNVPHSKYGDLTLHIKTQVLAITPETPKMNDSLPSGAESEAVGVLNETKILYQNRIQQALDAGDAQKASRLSAEAETLGIPQSEFLKKSIPN